MATLAHWPADFEPFSVDVCGLIDKAASDCLRRIASMYAVYHHKPLTYALAIVRRRVSFSIHLGSARQLISHLTHAT